MTGIEGIAITKEMIALITTIGVVPAVLIVVLCLFFVFREVKKQLALLEEALGTQKKNAKDQDDKLIEIINKHDDAIKYIERNYIEKEQHYRDFEGWKAEIQKVSDLIINLYKNGGGK